MKDALRVKRMWIGCRSRSCPDIRKYQASETNNELCFGLEFWKFLAAQPSDEIVFGSSLSCDGCHTSCKRFPLLFQLFFLTSASCVIKLLPKGCSQLKTYKVGQCLSKIKRKFVLFCPQLLRHGTPSLSISSILHCFGTASLSPYRLPSRHNNLELHLNNSGTNTNTIPPQIYLYHSELSTAHGDPPDQSASALLGY